MSSRTTHPVSTPRSDTEILFPRATGAGAANLVIPSGADGSDIVSATRNGTGIFDIVFRRKWPKGLCPQSPGIVGTTTGLVAIFTAWDPVAGTATVKFSVGSVATDPAVTDSIRFMFAVRNSGAN